MQHTESQSAPAPATHYPCMLVGQKVMAGSTTGPHVLSAKVVVGTACGAGHHCAWKQEL